jgi:monomeric sarcosine oxidase
MLRQQRIVIVGAGIVGLSTAYALLSEGIRHVVVLEQEAVDHQRASSHGPSRLLRFEYGPDAFYSHMVRLSLNRWQSLQQITRRTLYSQTGLLVLGTENDNFTQSSYQVLDKLGLPIERLSEWTCRQRFPQFATHTYDTLTFNTEGGVLHASTCLQTLKDCIIDLGGAIYESCRVTSIKNDDLQRPVRLRLGSGEELLADRVVLATGSWVHRLLANLHLPIRLTRQYLLYFAGLPTASFNAHVFPAFIADDLYGFPLLSMHNGHGSSWLKAASHTFGPSIDPEDTSPPDQRVIAQIVRKLRELLPALWQAKLVHIDSCMYDVSPDEDFILDRLPYDPRVIFATGLTGHGFKFGLLLGELLSSMVRDTQPLVALDRFHLARFSNQQTQQKSSVA